MKLLIFGALVVIAVGAGIYGSIRAGKRQNGLIDLARRLNLSFDATQHYTLADQYSFLKQLDRGDNSYATNILSGTYQSYPVQAFDFCYEMSNTDNKGNTQTYHHHWLSLVILTLPGVFPELSIRPENSFTKIAEAFGSQAIKFESAEFSKHFCVRSPDKKFAYDFCNAPMIEYLLANKDLSIEIENHVLAMIFNSRLSVEQIEKDLQRLVEIRARFPQYLIGNA
jgi:hypothetical protein